MEIICLQCGSVSKRAVRTIQGSFLLECFLWLLFILPGVIYSVWRLTTKAKVCPACSSREIVPLESPMGQKLQRELATAGPVTASSAILASSDAAIRCSSCGQQIPIGSTFCSNCGTKSPGASKLTPATTAPRNRSNLGRRVAWSVGGLIVGLPLLIVIASLAQHQPTVSSQTVPRQVPAATAPVSAHPVQLGELVVARQNSICGSSVQAFDEMIKWAVRRDEREMFRVLLTTGSSVWTTGSQAKVLDRGGFMYGRTKIRILKTQRECWVPSEAVQ
jgi:hypothetical protein